MPQSQAIVFLQKEVINAQYQITYCVSLPHRTASHATLLICSLQAAQGRLHTRHRFPHAFRVATGEPRQSFTGSTQEQAAPTLPSRALRAACETFTAPRIQRAFAAIKS